MSSVSRLPRTSDAEPPRPDLYQQAIEEYRFQAKFNWDRTQAVIVFDTSVLLAAVALAAKHSSAAVVVFTLGAVVSVLGWLVMRTQHEYYRAARQRLVRVEESLDIALDLRTDTTATQGGRSRTISVTQLIYLLLAAVAVADVVGAILTVA